MTELDYKARAPSFSLGSEEAPIQPLERMARESSVEVKIPPELQEELKGNFRKLIEGNPDLIILLKPAGSLIFWGTLSGYRGQHPSVAKEMAQKTLVVRIGWDVIYRFVRNPELNPERIDFQEDPSVRKMPEYQRLEENYRHWLQEDNKFSQEKAGLIARRVERRSLARDLRIYVANDSDYTAAIGIAIEEIVSMGIRVAGRRVSQLSMVNFFENHPVWTDNFSWLGGMGWVGGVRGGGVVGETFGPTLRDYIDERHSSPNERAVMMNAMDLLFLYMVEDGLQKWDEILAAGEEIARSKDCLNPTTEIEKIAGRESLTDFLPGLFEAFKEVGAKL